MYQPASRKLLIGTIASCILILLLTSGAPVAPPAAAAPARFTTNGQAAALVLGQLNFTSGGPAAGANRLSNARGIALDPTSGKIFVADQNNNRVLRFASLASLSNGANAEAVLGQVTFAATSPATTQSGMWAPNGVVVDSSGRLWVSEYSNHRVLRFDNAATLPSGASANAVLGQLNFTSSGFATAQNRMRAPQALAMDASGRLWVADMDNNRVLRFDNAAAKADGANADGVLGQTNFTSGGPATAQNRMSTPQGLALDSSGRLWVADSNNDRVLRFDNAAAKADGANADGVLGQTTFAGNTPALSQSRMNFVTGVATDSVGRLWVVDFGNNRVLRFDNAAAKANGANADGVLGQATFTTSTGATTQSGMFQPYHAVAGDNWLWVTEIGNNRALYHGPISPAGTVDTGGANDTGRFTSLAVVNGNPAISYLNWTTTQLTYARATNATGTAWGTPVTPGGVLTTSESSLAVANGNPAIATFSQGASALVFVRATDADGATWAAPIVVDATATFPYLSLAIVNGNPAIAYYDQTNGDLRYVRATDPGGATWGLPIVVAGTGDTGRSPSLALVDGSPAIAYYDQTSGDLLYVRATDVDGAGWGAPLTIDSAGSTGQDPSLVVVNGSPAIAYHNATNGDLMFIRAADVTGAAWGAAQIVDSSFVVGIAPSLLVVSGNPAISYYDATFGDLKHVRSIDANGAVWNTPLIYDSIINVGEYSSMAIVSGNPAVSYYDRSNGALKYVRSSSPTPVTLTSLEAARAGEGVELRWSTASEIDVVGFRALRSATGRREDAVAVSPLIAATGDSVAGASYVWVDAERLDGAAYWLAVVNRDGTPEEYGPVPVPGPGPATLTPRVFLPLARR